MQKTKAHANSRLDLVIEELRMCGFMKDRARILAHEILEREEDVVDLDLEDDMEYSTTRIPLGYGYTLVAPIGDH